MAMLNEAGREFARNLIESGLIRTDDEWQFTADDSAALADAAGDEGASRFHLGIDEERELYPFVKAGEEGVELHKAALVSISKRSGERGELDIHEAAESLLRAVEAAQQEAAAGSGDGDGDGGDGDTGGDGPGGRPIGPTPDGRDLTSRERDILAELKGKVLEKHFHLEGERMIGEADRAAREVEMSVSSETEYERWFGVEILDHSPGAVRLGRMQQNGPLLSEHWGPQIGAAKKVWLDETTRRVKARCKFGRSLRAEEEWQDVLDGIRTGVSIRYLVHSLRLEEERDGLEVYRVTDWEITHIALVAEPADVTVGVARSLDSNTGKEPTEERTMGEKNLPDPAELRAQVREEERNRGNEIRRVASMYRGKLDGIEGLEDKAINEGWEPQRFNTEIVELMGEKGLKAATVQKPDPKDALLGMSDKDVKRWSYMRAVRALVAMETGQSKRDIDEAAFELEVSRQVADAFGVDSVRGILVPFDVQLDRAMATSSTAAGGALVDTDLMVSNFIEQLTAKSVVLQNATVWEGLVGDINFPRGETLPTAYHVATEGGTITAESSPTTGLVNGTPRELGVYTNITRKMLKQSSIGIDRWVQNRQQTALRLKMEAMAINGSGGSGEPTGILQASGVGSVNAPSPASADSLFGMMVDLKSAMRSADAEMGNLAYVTNPDVQGLLEQTEKTSGNGQYIWVDGENGGRVAGRNAFATTLCPNNLGGTTDESAIIYGNWADLYLLLWGVIDLTLDRASLSTSGGLRVVSFQDYDIALAHPESFAAVTDLDVGNDY